jgi:hypothetical protein
MHARVFAVFTDAELEPTPLFTGNICDGCLARSRGCLRACLDHLERSGRIQARFRTPLIERERYLLGPPP